MRKFSPEFTAHIASETTSLCWAWKLQRRDGLVLGFTDHDRALDIEGVPYQAASGFSPSDVDSRLGFALDNSALQGLLSSGQIKDVDIRAGKYDGAAVSVFRVNWQDTAEFALMWSGYIGDITSKDGHFEAELVGKANRLERSIGRVFSRTCDASFGDTRCGLDTNSFSQGTVCPRTFEACKNQFDNTVNFRGFPYLIGDDESYAPPREGSVKDGRSRYKT